MLHNVFSAKRPAPAYDAKEHLIDSRYAKSRILTNSRTSATPTSIEEMKQKSKKVLLNIKTVFPFKLFPTRVIVDVHRIIVIEQTFLFADTIRSIPIQNVQYVRCDRSLLFGTLCLRTYGFSDREVVISHLWNRDALYAHRLIEGLLICYEDNLDPMTFGDRDMSANLQNIGSAYSGTLVS